MGILKLKIIWLIFVSVFLCSCEIIKIEGEEKNPAEVHFFVIGEDNWKTIRKGEYLKVNAEIDFEESSEDLVVKRIECFLGNIKIASSESSKCEVYYKIDNMQTGEYEFRIEADVSAPDYDQTVGYCFITVNITD